MTMVLKFLLLICYVKLVLVARSTTVLSRHIIVSIVSPANSSLLNWSGILLRMINGAQELHKLNKNKINLIASDDKGG